MKGPVAKAREFEELVGIYMSVSACGCGGLWLEGEGVGGWAVGGFVRALALAHVRVRPCEPLARQVAQEPTKIQCLGHFL